jgi:PAS domain S-box-containing protein
LEDLHSLLKRQLKRHFGSEFKIPPEWQSFIDSINASYHDFDSDREMLERSLEISSQELMETNTETRSIIEIFPDAFLWLDKDGNLLSYKSSGQKDQDLFQGILNNSNIQDIQQGSIKDILQQAIRQSIESKIAAHVEFSIKAHKQIRHYEARVIPPLSNRILVIIRDLTEKKLAEERVQESERRFRELAELLPVVAIEMDIAGNLTYFNDMALKVSGYTREELSQINAFQFIAPEDRNRSITNAQRTLAGENIGGIEYNFIKKDGTFLSTLVQAAGIKDSRGALNGLRVIMVDISERKNIERALQESEEKYHSLVENIKLGIFRTQPKANGQLIEANKAMEELTGYTRDELLKMEVVKLYPSPEERTEFLNQLSLNPDKAILTSHLQRKDGSEIAVTMIAKAIKDAKGNLLYIDGTIEDITERKKLEERIIELYQHEKRQRQELEEEAKTRGMFVNVLAHELRTPLTPIIASVGMLNDLLSDKTSIQGKLAENINKSANILTNRLEELLDIARYSRGTFKLKMQPVDAGKYLKDVTARFKPSIDQRGQTLTVEIAEKLPEIEIDPSKLEQVIVNLLSNASKFSPQNAHITFTSRMQENRLLVEVHDQGIGITPEEIQRIFQPYHRVEQDRLKFPGLGLGLAVARQIIEAHNGKIWVTSQPEQGSIFSFLIPVTAKKAN